MDPEGYLSIFLIVIGSFLSFLTATLSYVSQQKIKEAIKHGDENATLLNKFRNRYEESLNSLLIIELLFYLMGAIFTVHVSDFQGKILDIVYILVLIISLRIVFYFLGVRFANTLALKCVPIISILIRVGSFFPFIIEKLNTISGGQYTEEETKDEINAIVETALEDGAIDRDEYRILKSIIKFSDVKVEDVMTPRTVVFSCRADQTINETINMPELKNYSRFPIWDGDNIDKGLRGYVMTREVLYAALVGKGDSQLKDLTKEIYLIAESSPLDLTLEKFLTRQQHIMAVVDDYGGFEGLITMEDVLETIIGVEIVDEADQEMDLRELAKRKRDNRISRK
ncbi:CNNM domain-containing protein [Candidatus Kapabacteria bacterium]|nr:CNNM domain-containing protein [Candidatus Kapabacteria bacterium]